jgi:uncharacterized protein with HEPN domain
MSERDTRLLLEDMLESANKINRYVGLMSYDEFIEDEKTVDAVIRNFEIIGEAANRIDPDYKLTYPNIEWNRMRGFRNRVIHEYFGIDYEIVWAIIQDDLNDLIGQLEGLKNVSE